MEQDRTEVRVMMQDEMGESGQGWTVLEWTAVELVGEVVPLLVHPRLTAAAAFSMGSQ